MASVLSSSVVAETSTTSLTITKPTGLVVGDVLVAAIVEEAGGTPATPSGWTALTTLAATNLGSRVFAYFAKAADSSDVAASNFSFAPSTGTKVMSGVLYRTSCSQDLTQFDGDGQVANDNTTPPVISISVTPPNADSLLFAIIGAGSITPTTISDPVISGTNPAWTELNQQIDGSVIYGFYHAEQPTTTEITTITASSTVRASTTDDAAILVALGNRVDATGTNTLVTTTSAAFAQAGTSDTVGTNTLIETDTESFTQSGQATSPTQWSNEAKPSTAWVNEQI